MGKIVKAVAGLAIVAAIAIAAPYLAPGIISAFASLGVTIAPAVGLGIAQGILALGAGLVMSAFAPKPASQGAVPLNIRQALNDSTIIIGKCRVGAKLTFFHPGVDRKTYRYFVWTVAGHRCHALTKWYLNDDQVTVDGSGKVTSGPYANAAWLWFDRGTEDATANATFVAECGGQWTTNHRGRGVAKIYAKFKMADDVVKAGMPTVTAEIEGSDEIYDPRGESTGYTNNAILAFYWWMALPRAEGGFGCYSDEIDWDWVAAQANVCDEDVPLAAGGTEKRYALDGFLTTGSDPSAVRDVLVTNMAGRFTYSGGLMLARPGYWVPVSSTISEDDLIGPIEYDLLATGDERVTEVVATWNNPATGYQPGDLPALSVESEDEAQAGIDLPFVKSAARVQRIKKIKLLQGQAEKALTWPLNIMGLGIGPMDTVQIDTDRYSLGNYAFTVGRWALSQDFSIVLNVREENPEMYDWSPEEEDDTELAPAIDRAEPVPDSSEAIAAIGGSYTAGLAGNVSMAVDGSTITVTIPDHTRIYPTLQKSVGVVGGDLEGLSPETSYWFAYDDPDLAGGAVTYLVLTDAADAYYSDTHPYRHFIAAVTTPNLGGGGGSSTGSGPPGSGGWGNPIP